MDNRTFTIRIIIDQPRSAAFNMAADQYALQKCVSESMIYLRFYSWEVPTISIGYSEKAQDLLKLDLLRQKGLSWIRRPTGGRAVLHHEDLTYSCIFPRTAAEVMGSTVAQSYRIISKCLIKGLRDAGIDCDTHDSYDQFRELRREVKLPCFLAPNRDEIMVHGKKLAGSAQKRTESGVLQHGSIPLTPSYRHLPSYLNIQEQEQDRHYTLLCRKSTCIEEITAELGRLVLVQCLIGGFTTSLPCTSIVSEWTCSERSEILEMAESAPFISVWME
jgi:lipoyl(octanoyl) transferase